MFAHNFVLCRVLSFEQKWTNRKRLRSFSVLSLKFLNRKNYSMKNLSLEKLTYLIDSWKCVNEQKKQY